MANRPHDGTDHRVVDARMKLRLRHRSHQSLEPSAPQQIVTLHAFHFWSLRIEEETMGMFSKDITTLDDLYKHGLHDLYYAENEILKALPAMIEKATDGELKRGLKQHLGETEEQVKRLEQVFKRHDEEPSGEKCPAIDGIIEEGNDLMAEVGDPAVLSVGIIAAAQAVEHYEITRYGALIAWAKQLGHGADATILARNLKEEKAADKKLTALAERRVNPKSERRPGRSPSQARRAKAKASPRRAAASRRKSPMKRKSSARR
jgi:ferritin-like metal-binding protein YciE